MTGDNVQKTFQVVPSTYLTDYITKCVTNPYLKAQIEKALQIRIPGSEVKIQQNQLTPEQMEERLCPTCKNNLVFAEGCNICIECGYSGCTSG
jgi:ribonucleoside-diphosphate reductase alpha chain